MSQPPESRSENNPWPEWPVIFRVDYGHEESNKVLVKTQGNTSFSQNLPLKIMMDM